MATRKGTSRADTLFGTSGADSIFGGDGNDLIYGGPTSNWYQKDRGDRIDGGRGNDTIHGGYGDDYFIHGPGADQYLGFAGRDTLDYSKATSFIRLTVGGFAAFNDGAAKGDEADSIDVVIGTRFSDNIEADSGIASTLRGGAGNDTLSGGFAADRLVGDNGADRLFGDYGNDKLYGGVGADELYGEEGDDQLFGGAGNDVFYGGLGKDTIFGGAGKDFIFLGDGDRVSGGGGADSFDFANLTGRVVITDFDVKSGDRIILPSLTFSSFEEVMKLVSRKGNDVVIRPFEGRAIVLEDVAKSDLREDDFYF